MNQKSQTLLVKWMQATIRCLPNCGSPAMAAAYNEFIASLSNQEPPAKEAEKKKGDSSRAESQPKPIVTPSAGECPCRNWCRDGVFPLTQHHPRCAFYNLKVESVGIICRLVRAMEVWGEEEDGIFKPAWEAYITAKSFIGEFDYEASPDAQAKVAGSAPQDPISKTREAPPMSWGDGPGIKGIPSALGKLSEDLPSVPRKQERVVDKQITRQYWFPMKDAPRDGTVIIGLYDDGEALITWSKCPVCMLGTPHGTFPPGWATAGNDTDRNLPMDEPKAWRPLQPDKPAQPADKKAGITGQDPTYLQLLMERDDLRAKLQAALGNLR